MKEAIDCLIWFKVTWNLNYQGAANISFTAWHDFPEGSVFIHVMDRYCQYNKQNDKALQQTPNGENQAALQTLRGCKSEKKKKHQPFFCILHRCDLVWVFSCLGQLNRWRCHWVSQWVSRWVSQWRFDFSVFRALNNKWLSDTVDYYWQIAKLDS